MKVQWNIIMILMDTELFWYNYKTKSRKKWNIKKTQMGKKFTIFDKDKSSLIDFVLLYHIPDKPKAVRYYVVGDVIMLRKICFFRQLFLFTIRATWYCFIWYFRIIFLLYTDLIHSRSTSEEVVPLVASDVAGGTHDLTTQHEGVHQLVFLKQTSVQTQMKIKCQWFVKFIKIVLSEEMHQQVEQ